MSSKSKKNTFASQKIVFQTIGLILSVLSPFSTEKCGKIFLNFCLQFFSSTKLVEASAGLNFLQLIIFCIEQVWNAHLALLSAYNVATRSLFARFTFCSAQSPRVFSVTSSPVKLINFLGRLLVHKTVTDCFFVAVC